LQIDDAPRGIAAPEKSVVIPPGGILVSITELLGFGLELESVKGA
jgi:hypothetical protein